MDYYTALKRSSKILDGYFEQSKDILHNASKGAVRESILNRVIRPFLPSCYGLSGGEAFDSEGNVSKQLDLIVYDSVFSYAVPYIENYIQFPCESIYGNIEIKSMLNHAEFEKAVENIRSLKCLKREGTHSWTVTPQVAISINGKPSDNNRNPYFGVIFAYDSVEPETVLSYLEKVDYPSCELPNAIILYSKKTLIIHSLKGVIYSSPIDTFDKYISLYCGDDILAIFIGLLINFTRYTLLKVANIDEQTNSLLSILFLDNTRRGTKREIVIQ
jgi:hypothetical protein